MIHFVQVSCKMNLFNKLIYIDYLKHNYDSDYHDYNKKYLQKDRYDA